ncbi:MAG TPA: hypothetical protein VNY06_01120 [Methylocella sp.]|jgi:hypothetical protein|nr:hypothetical protein [Methylocella sp.]
MTLRYVRAKGPMYTDMLNNMRQTPLCPLGDAILVWVNEGDFWRLTPTDVETEAKDRAEYERLKAKFGFKE